MSTNTDNGLLPCPFCGGSAEVIDDRLGFYVECQNNDCGVVVIGPRVPELQSEEEASGMNWGALEQSARSKWNGRATSTQTAPVVPDELKEAAADFLAVLDEYPEQLVPVNRDSATIRTLRAAMLSTSQKAE